jgi:lipoate-protein ligase A
MSDITSPTISSEAWRVITDPARPGALNMALDEALLVAQATGDLPPTLRLYAWEPPCMSLGYFQRATAEVDLAACAAAGVDVVRRPTGGRAVLHEHELTYSIVVRQALLPGSVLDTYQVLSEGLLAGLRYLGIKGEQVRPRPKPARNEQAAAAKAEDGLHAACFDAPSWYETVVAGRKIIGSAQTRRDGVILQHGSLLLSFDPARLTGLLRVRQAERRPAMEALLAAKATSVADVTGRAVGFEEAARAITCGLAAALRLTMFQAGYAADEIELAKQLYRDKYTTEQWTLRR